jgi:hypothetical protein
MQQAQQMEMVKQTANLAKAPLLDPSKNPELMNQNGQPNPDQATAAQQEAGVPGGNLLG